MVFLASHISGGSSYNLGVGEDQIQQHLRGHFVDPPLEGTLLQAPGVQINGDRCNVQAKIVDQTSIYNKERSESRNLSS